MRALVRAYISVGEWERVADKNELPDKVNSYLSNFNWIGLSVEFDEETGSIINCEFSHPWWNEKVEG